jgi:hypothetical protein
MCACAHTVTRQAFLVKISSARTSKDLTKTAPELTKARQIRGIHVARYRGSKQQRSSRNRIATESADNTMSIWRLQVGDGMGLEIQKKWEVNVGTALVMISPIAGHLF